MGTCWRMWLMKQNPNPIGGIYDNTDGDQWAWTLFIVAAGQTK